LSAEGKREEPANGSFVGVLPDMSADQVAHLALALCDA
jgi:hypothetical protein